MFPIKHSWIFRSRYMALLWAAGIIWFALDVAGPPAKAHDGDGDNAQEEQVTDIAGQPVSEDQVKQLEDKLRDM